MWLNVREKGGGVGERGRRGTAVECERIDE